MTLVCPIHFTVTLFRWPVFASVISHFSWRSPIDLKDRFSENILAIQVYIMLTVCLCHVLWFTMIISMRWYKAQSLYFILFYFITLWLIHVRVTNYWLPQITLCLLMDFFLFPFSSSSFSFSMSRYIWMWIVDIYT